MEQGTIKRVAIINDTDPTHHFGCMLVMENLRFQLRQQGVEVVWTWPVGIDWRKHKRAIRKKGRVDAFIVNGEGTIHHSKERKHARALSEFATFAREAFGVDAYLINATLFQNEASEYAAMRAYKKIYVRDKGSLAELESFGLQGRYIPDLTFAKNNFQFDEVVDSEKIEACVIDSALKSELPFLKQFCRQRGYTFRSMVVARLSNVNFFKSPRPFVKNFYKWLTQDRSTSIRPRDFIQFLKGHRLVITGRYHTVTMCIKQQIPFIAFESNTPKVSFLLNDIFNQTDRVVPMRDIEQLPIENWAHFSANELEQMRKFVSAAEADISEMITCIVDDIHMTKTNQGIE